MRYEMIHRGRDMAGEERNTRELVLLALENFGEDVLTYQGSSPGSSVFFIGGTHGNEILGVLAVAALREEIESGSVVLKSGAVRLAIGNPRAVRSNTRTTEREIDFNRIFKPNILDDVPVQGWEESRARAIAEEIQRSDVTIDLHSTNLPSPAFACSSSSEAHRSVHRWLPRVATVIDPERLVSGGGGSMDEYADDCGRVGICYESGHVGDLEAVIPVYNALKAILIERGIIEGVLPEPPSAEAEYIVTGSISYVAGREFTFVSEKARSFAPVTKGEVIGYRGGEAVLSPIDGVILFPKKPKDQPLPPGVVCYLATRLPDAER
jgi:predicted deacylase